MISSYADHRQAWQLVAAGALLCAGIAFRLPIADYTGPPDSGAFTAHLFTHFGSYSDIASLYFRDQLWQHPVPYIDYSLEYPVVTGLLVWGTGLVARSAWSYVVWNGVVQAVAALALVHAVAKRSGRRTWLLAVAPALALYVVLNWDFVAVALMVGSLLMFERDRDLEGAALLTLSIWAKFFPLLVLPLVLAQRWGKRSFWRIIAVVASGSVFLNLPFALERQAAGLGLRQGWLHFFVYNRDRPREVNVWNLFDDAGLTTAQINAWSATLTIIGVAVIALVVYRIREKQFLPLVATASVAALAWFFFLSKVYSPQYGIWIIALLPLALIPMGLGAYFLGIDAFYFATSFIALGVASDWFYGEVLIPSMLMRESILLTIALCALVMLWRSRDRGLY